MEKDFVLTSLLYLTNPFDEDYEASWNGDKYIIEAHKMTPVVVSTPIENQNIRKVRALGMCQRELGKNKKFRKAMYTDLDLQPLMAKCLAPLEKTEPKMKTGVKSKEEKERQAKVEAVFKLPEEYGLASQADMNRTPSIEV